MTEEDWAEEFAEAPLDDAGVDELLHDAEEDLRRYAIDAQRFLNYATEQEHKARLSAALATLRGALESLQTGDMKAREPDGAAHDAPAHQPSPQPAAEQSEDALAVRDLASDTAADLDECIERARQFMDGFDASVPGDPRQIPPMADPAARASMGRIIAVLQAAKRSITEDNVT